MQIQIEHVLHVARFERVYFRQFHIIYAMIFNKDMFNNFKCFWFEMVAEPEPMIYHIV